MSADLSRALEQVVTAGADRILTSGGAQTAIEGSTVLRTLVERANGRVIIMACGGIDDQNVQLVLEKTGVREIHAGLRTSVESPMKYRGKGISRDLLGKMSSGDWS